MHAEPRARARIGLVRAPHEHGYYLGTPPFPERAQRAASRARSPREPARPRTLRRSDGRTPCAPRFVLYPIRSMRRSVLLDDPTACPVHSHAILRLERAGPAVDDSSTLRLAVGPSDLRSRLTRSLRRLAVAPFDLDTVRRIIVLLRPERAAKLFFGSLGLFRRAGLRWRRRRTPGD